MDTLVLAIGAGTALVIVQMLLLGIAWRLRKEGARALPRPAAPQPPAPRALPDIGILGHDLRAPLNSIITLSQMLLDGSAGALNEGQRTYASVIHRSGRDLLVLINHVVELARIDAGIADVRLGAVDSAWVIHEVIRAQIPEAAARSMRLRAAIPPALPAVNADQDRLHQIVSELIDAASIQAGRDGEIVIAAELAGSCVVFRVRAHRSRIGADVAAGAEGQRHKPDLGLLVCRRLLALMDGDLIVHEDPTDETRFTFTLVGSKEASDSSTATAEPDPGSHPDSHRGRNRPRRSVSSSSVRPSVLIIDDDAGERTRVASLIAGGSFDVASAASGKEGLALLRRRRFDAVVLDLVMPEMSGLDVLREAQRDERLRGVPFVVLSALYMTWAERDVLGPTVVQVVQKGELMPTALMSALQKAVAPRERDVRSAPLP